MISPGQIRPRENFIQWVQRFLNANKRVLRSRTIRHTRIRKTLTRKTA